MAGKDWTAEVIRFAEAAGGRAKLTRTAEGEIVVEVDMPSRGLQLFQAAIAPLPEVRLRVQVIGPVTDCAGVAESQTRET